MTDFLDRLVGRSVGSMPTVQPRMLSRFEAGPLMEKDEEEEPAGAAPLSRMIQRKASGLAGAATGAAAAARAWAPAPAAAPPAPVAAASPAALPSAVMQPALPVMEERGAAPPTESLAAPIPASPVKQWSAPPEPGETSSRPSLASAPAADVRPFSVAEAPAPPTEEAGPPIVRISIGRIDVQAILPPAAPTPAAAPRRSQMQTLEEHLHGSARRR
jgi:DNA polymerase-3 subunit gamma/tau